MNCSAILLAGGKSRRFGSDKARIELDGRPLLHGLVDACAALFDEVLVAGTSPGRALPPGVRVLRDRVPGAGPLGGLHAGLHGCRHDLAFVTACDMPAFHAGLAAQLAELAAGSPEADAVVPRGGDGKVEPLFAVYAKRALPVVEAQLAQGRRAMMALLDRLAVRWLDEADWRVDPAGRDRLFCNLNTPQDLEALLRERGGGC